MLLPVDDLQVLKADDDENDRGLLVKLLEDGSYEVAYWYDDLDVYPIEIVVDGESVKKDAKKVTFKFHPELDKALLKKAVVMAEVAQLQVVVLATGVVQYLPLLTPGFLLLRMAVTEEENQRNENELVLTD